MRLVTVALVASASVALAQPHQHERRHGHGHLHPYRVKRVPDAVTHIVYTGPTVVVYELNGQVIPESEVQQGIANGTLTLGDDGVISSAAPSSTTTPDAGVFAEAFSSTPAYTPTPTPTPTPSSSEAPASSAAPSTSDSSSNNNNYNNGGGATGIDSDFDESTPCSTFPSAFGAVSLDYLGIGGWSGIQNPSYSGSDGFNLIKTLTKDLCLGGNCCTEGSYCSYACPAGYQKTQWPRAQGTTGQSVGGLKCSGGQLKLTRGDVTKKICEKGTTSISIKVKNTMGQGAAICRTDYPGTEAETIPVWAASGSESDLACPDGASYYQKNGAPTSAQYYVNPAGVSVEDGCQWGDKTKPWGNWAPLNMGVGYSDSKGWISLFQNWPTTMEKLDFTVEIQGDQVVGKCRYQDGQYCSGENYDNCNSKDGCTVAVTGGTAYFVFS